MWLFISVFYLDFKNFHFLISLFCSRLKKEEDSLMTNIDRQKEEISSIAAKV